MKFGLNFFPAFRSNILSTADYFVQTLRLCERADVLGYTSVKTVEHYFNDYGGHSPNPSILLAAISARTSHLRLMTGAVIPAFNHPIKLAGELAMLDNLSGGRLDVGFGRAFLPEEFEAFHIPMDESRARFEEGIEVIKRLWNEDRVTHDGSFHHLNEVHLLPRPVQQPSPPIWIAAISSEESFIWAGRNGYNLMVVPYAGGLEHTAQLVKLYQQARREAGYAGSGQVQVAFHAYIAPTHAEALEGFQAPMTTYLGVFSEAVQGWKHTQSSNYKGYEKLVQAITSQTWKTQIDGRTALVGTPEQVTEQIVSIQQLYGDIELSLQVLFGNIPYAEALRTIELFGQQIMPHFQDETLGETRIEKSPLLISSQRGPVKV